MKKIYQSVAEMIGHTPLLAPQQWMKNHHTAGGELFLKVEALNPSGSVKDRAALGMLEALEESGRLQRGGTLIEPTSGNTGIALAALAAARGYRAILTLPETMSVERRNLLRAYGAELVLTPGKEGMKGAIEKAMDLAREIPGAVIPDQFANEANARYHYRTTGPEIWEALDGQVDGLIAGVGTGGTLTGTARYLREKNPELEVIAVEPATSAVLSGEVAGKHGIQGIGAGFIPDVLDRSLISRVIKVSDEEAFLEARLLARTEGLLTGISSGAALAAASIRMNEGAAGMRFVVILPDSGDRYLSTPLYYQED